MSRSLVRKTALGLLLLVAAAVPAPAATFTVRNLNDSGIDSLRQAILNANANPGPDTIDFQAELTGTITLTTGQLTITDDLTIQGPGADPLTISGNHAGWIFEIQIDATVSLDGLTITDGRGGIQNFGTLTVTNCTFDSNTGSAISNRGPLQFEPDINFVGMLTVANCTFSRNEARDGAAIFNLAGSATVTNSNFISNRGGTTGGAIVNSFGGALMVTDSIFAFNGPSFTAGGIFNDRGTLSVTRSTFAGNVASRGGGIVNTGSLTSGILTVMDCEFIGNIATAGGDFGGGGIRTTGGTVTVANSIFSGNSAGRDGGGIASTSSASLTVTNCTFSGNSAVRGGGGIYNGAQLTVTNCTFAANSAPSFGGGIWIAGSIHATLTVTNSILWGNAEEQIGWTQGAVTVTHSNVGLPDNAVWPGSGNLNADPLFVRNPFTFGANDFGNLRLQSFSPCINAGDNAAVTVPPFPTDEFGNPIDLAGLPRIVGGRVDMGAYEFQDTAPGDPGDPGVREQVVVLMDDVADLVVAGVPLPAGGRPLYAKLDAAIAALEAGDLIGAQTALQDFINQVYAMWLARRLSTTQRDALIAAALVIIAAL